MAKRLPAAFFARNVDRVARDLIGVTLTVDGVGGVIVETESYDCDDPAAHTFGGRRTPRNGVMFGPAGHAYVYIAYGLHWCLNLTCGNGSAVLIRALEPTRGLDVMARHRGVDDVRKLCAGPGRLCQALGIAKALDGASLVKPPFALFERDKPAKVLTGTRIGITKAIEHPRRFGLQGSRFLSRPIIPQGGQS